jgi:polar amino acid transport system permease protein
MKTLIDNFFNLTAAEDSWRLLLYGLLNLLKLVAVSSVLALIVGAVFLSMRRSHRKWLSGVQIWLIDIVRGIPPLVLLVVVYYLVPPIGPITINTFTAAVATFGVVQGAYVSEILRGGLAAVDRGQYEASAALGLRPRQVVRHVISPQVFRVVIPPMTSQATQLVRDASLTFFIGYEEIVTRSREAVSLTSNSTPYTMALVIYAVLLLTLQYIARRLEAARVPEEKSKDVRQRLRRLRRATGPGRVGYPQIPWRARGS